VDIFEEVIALDPGYALAHAGLAQALALSSFWGIARSEKVCDRAVAAAARALAADPMLPEAHHAMGFTALTIEYDRDKASRAWERAIELDPGNPDSHILRGVFDLTYVRQDFDAAERELSTAIEQDPQSSYAYTSMAVSLTFGHREARGLGFADRGVELDPNSLYAHWVRLLTIALMGRHSEVLADARRLSDRFGRHPWILMAISIGAGIAEEHATAEAVYHEVKGRAALEYVQRPILAVAALNAGRREEAYAHLHAAVRERDGLFPALALDWGGFARLRKTPEYDAVLREMGWAPAGVDPEGAAMLRALGL
jgi:tetratricopeptide (TPR) repeat protein